MKRRLLTCFLCLSMVPTTFLVAATEATAPAAKNSAAPTAGANPPAAAPQDQTPTSVRPGTTTTQKRSYEREAHRRHSGISKGEVVFMGAIAGTSMGIGAIAGGGVGLAIGAIVGGWGAYAAHRFWHYFNK